MTIRERLEQQRIMQEMEEHRTPSGGIESEQPKEDKAVPAVRFVLKDVRIDSSELLPESTAKAAYGAIGGTSCQLALQQ